MGAEIKTENGKLPSLSFKSVRRFGLELELLAFDGQSRPPQGQRPSGIEQVAEIVSANSVEGTEVRDWEHTSNNDQWIIKPDSSCGMEVCSPILKGWTGLRKCCEVSYGLKRDPRIKVDNRCSVHCHVEVADLDPNELGSVIAHWFKIEPIIMDAMPLHRKRNRYCQFMGMTSIVQAETKVNAADLVKRVGNVKYYSLNTNQMVRNGRKTVEFRTIEGDGVIDPYLIKNWVRLIIHFIEMARKLPLPTAYNPDDCWSGLCWLDVEDTLKLLGFNNNPHQYELSPGLTQTRNWLLSRLQKYMSKDVDCGPRSYAYKDLCNVIKRFEDEGVRITPEQHLSPTDLQTALYSEESKV